MHQGRGMLRVEGESSQAKGRGRGTSDKLWEGKLGGGGRTGKAVQEKLWQALDT